MRTPRFVLSAALAMCSAFAFGQASPSHKAKPEPPVLGVHWARGMHVKQASTSPNMTWHGGPVLPSTATAAIYWGTSWTTTNYKVLGMDSWYIGVNGSTYAATSDEYKGSNGQVTSSISYGGHYVDTTAAPTRAPKTSTILAEVCRVIPKPVSNGLYSVYVDTPRGHAGYCAWHSWASCGGTPVQFAFYFNLDNDAGCNPEDSVTGHPEGLAALANVTGHELSEARTDPRGSAWYDSSGAENADKCAWTFGTKYLTFSNGTKWKIQGNWSNKAFSNGTGYPNSSGQDGCIDGGNYK